MLTRLRDMPFALRAALGVLLITSLMAFWGPYGTGRFGWPSVWYYWAGLMIPGWTMGLLVEAVIRRVRPGWPFLARYSLVAALASVAVIAANYVTHAARGVDLVSVDHTRLVLQVTVLTYVITLVYGAARRGLSGPAATDETVPERRAGSPLAEKLDPLHRRADLIALMSEDHYLRVHTSAGDSLVRLSLGEALTAVAQIDGARVHRSWWVARDAVDRIEKSSGRMRLVLSNGVKAPVSRSQTAHLRDAGWF